MVELELEVLGHYQEMASRLIGQCIHTPHTTANSRDGDIISNDSAAKILGLRKVIANEEQFCVKNNAMPTMPG